jgi:hypothetical protein
MSDDDRPQAFDILAGFNKRRDSPTPVAVVMEGGGASFATGSEERHGHVPEKSAY